MSYDLGVLDLKGGEKKKRTRLYAAVGIAIAVVAVVIAVIILMM